MNIDRDRSVARVRALPRAGRLAAPFVLTASAALLAGMLAGCEPDGSAGTDEALAQDGAEPRSGRIVNVETERIEAGPFEEVIRVTGTVRANQDVTVSAEESGVIREVLVERGRVVREGTPILRIDDRTLRSQVREAEARAALARETWERRRRLFEDDGVGSELAYLEARYQAEQADAVLETLRERLERTVVRAPISGVLDDRLVEVGTMVAAGTPVVRIVQVNPVKVRGGVPERYAGDVVPGSRASVSFDALEGEEIQARVGYVSATVNPSNRTFEVEVVIPNPGRVIKPEMVANIRIVRQDLEDAIVIPQNALIRVEEGFVAFVVGMDGSGEPVARVRPVSLGPAQQNRVVVHDGIRPGDRLIVVGQQEVADGDRIRIVNDREAER